MAAVYLFSSKAVKAFQRQRREAGINFCWFWHRQRDTNGFGLFDFGGKVIFAHHFAWMLDRQQFIPQNNVVVHNCRYPPCVNPAHLDLAILTMQKSSWPFVVENGEGDVITGAHSLVMK